MADITVQFSDGTSHIYKNAPDSATQDDVIARAAKDFVGKEITNLQRSLKKQKVDASQIPVEPGANTTPTVEPEQSLADIIRGIVETPVAVAANLATGPITYLSGAGGPEFQQQVARNIQYQPRTQMAQDVLTGIGRRFEASKIPPFMPGTMQFQPLVSDVAMQARAVGATQVANAPVKINDVINAIRTQEQKPTMVGMGAAETGKALERQTRAQSLRVPVDLTKGQATREPGTQRFETETAKTYPETVGAPLLQRQIDTNQKILSNFDAYTSATGAEMSGLLRPVGQIIDAALVKQAKEAKDKINSAYTAARASGDTKALVRYEPLVSYIEEQGPTVRQQLAPILGAVEDQLRRNDPDGLGVVSIDALEDIYQFINKNAQPDTPNAVQAIELKNLINKATEGAGGDLYKKARQLRVQYARQFEDASAVDKLLRKKPGTTDRAVAFEDVFQHSILNGSFDDTRNIAVLLKKGGEQGQQAWKELQGQTLNYIQEQATKNIQRDANGRPIPSAAAMNNVIRNLDADGKLDYIFGKKGAEEIRNLRDVIMDVYSPVQGTVNYSNTTSTLINALQNINKTPLSRVPGVGAATKYVEESAKQKALKKMVDESLKYQP
jgi:hypothetical protein